MGKVTVQALRAVLVVMLAGTVFLQALMAWALATDPEDGTLPLTPLRVIVILGAATLAVLLVAGPSMEPPGILFLGGIGVAFLGVALIVLVLRMLLAQAVARDVEAAHMQAELDAVI